MFTEISKNSKAQREMVKMNTEEQKEGRRRILEMNTSAQEFTIHPKG